LPTPAQLREKAPALAAKLPGRDQLMSGAQELVGHARSVQRLVVEQVRTVAVPLAHQAAARLAKVGAQPAQSQTATRVSGVQVSSAVPVKNDSAKADTTKGDTTKADTTKADTTKGEHAPNGQPKPKPRAKSTTK